ncbi:hypothetical protein A2V54_00065 [candidate division WWE3 bacterium RBG_19FT_COMBO_53_11]|uniref:Uncharacterized protein n=1 Tax=candidate division WWE3 bacterium RBG_19FT_COMBO_53_11 TaxID=1802613 RepID=A0A1F4UK55_UNCKA|nr:MAG: hypothetical protein A2155_02805 [candidate division WWE3 bacterium RBG_16_52_45]OGC44593.1 MAG: hypothetical protein A2V54_00065 [candidate division WWE3 bacterium RBG_19FT_COMBO_53_11]
MHAQRNHKISLFYIIGTFPVLSETFIKRELIELFRDKRLNIKIVYFRHGDNKIPIDPVFRSKLWYFRPGLTQLLKANAVEFFRKPFKYLDLLRLILFGRHRSFSTKFIDLGSLLVGATLAYEIRGLGIDQIHANFATWPTTIALVVSTLNGIPFTFTGHAHDLHYKQMLLREKISRAKTVVTCTQFNLDYLISLARPVDKKKIFCVHHGIEFTGLEKRKVSKNSPPLILSVGRLVPFKGFNYLIDSLGILKAKGGKFKAVIIGGGQEKENLSWQIERSGLNNDVELLGARPFAEVKNYFQSADVFVAPSVIAKDNSFDGIPNVLMEAMAFGAPIVSTNISGIPEAVTDGKNGLLVKSGDALALSKAIGTLLTNEGLRDKFRKAGYKRVGEMFDLQKNVERFKQAIFGGMLN